MALIKCPECGNEFSSYATECPQCGFPAESINGKVSRCNPSSKKRLKDGWIIGGIAAIVLLIAVGVISLKIITNKRQLEEERKEKHRQELIQKSNDVQSQIESERLANEALEERIIEEERERRQNDVSWLYGKWYLNSDGESLFLYINKDKLTWGGMDRGVPITVWDGNYTLYMDRIEILGEPAFAIDLEEQKVYTLNGKAWAKSSTSGSYSSNADSYSSVSSSTSFHTSAEVMAYVSNRFKNSEGIEITVREYGILNKGQQISNAVRVVSFSGSRATLSTSSPFSQGTLYFTVDASRGTLTDGSGDVFYIQ